METRAPIGATGLVVRGSLFRTGLVLFTATMVFGAGGSAWAQLGRQGRWLTYGGHPVYMVGVDLQSAVGAHAWDDGEGGGYDGDYVRLLDAVQAAGLNKVRVWANVYFRPADAVEQPFLRTPSGKYDLYQWNPAYWARLRDFVEQARQRGIFVEYCLFAQYSRAGMVDGTYDANYWASANNVNGAFDDTDETAGLLYEFFRDEGGSVDGHPLSYFQDRLMEKALAELGGYGNVYFLVMNEPDTADAAALSWMRARAARLKSLANVLVATEVRPDPWPGPRGGLVDDLPELWDDPNIDIIGGHAYDTNPARLSDKLHAAQLQGKILADDEGYDLLSETSKAVREAWGWAMAGGYYSFFVRDRDFVRVGGSAWHEAIQAATTLKSVFESVPFWEMSPVDALGHEYDVLVAQAPGAGGSQVLAAPGRAYLIYTWGTPTSQGLVVDLEPGHTYDYVWRDARNGSVLASGEVEGQAGATIVAPRPSAWSGAYGLVAVVVSQDLPAVDAGPGPGWDAGPDGGPPTWDAGALDRSPRDARGWSDGAEPTEATGSGGCSCSVAPEPLAWAWLAVLVLFVRRRCGE